MYHLKKFQETPPGGWRYTQQESGLVVQSATYSSLVQKVMTHRKANGYVIEDDVERHIQDQICRSLSGKAQIKFCDTGIPSPASRRIRLSEVVKFLTSAVQWLGAGAPMVSQEEADRRAAICADCPWNVHVYGCAACHALSERTVDLLGDKRTSSDAHLKACGICGCSNRAQAWLPLDVLLSDSGNLEYPGHCWKAYSTHLVSPV